MDLFFQRYCEIFGSPKKLYDDRKEKEIKVAADEIC